MFLLLNVLAVHISGEARDSTRTPPKPIIDPKKLGSIQASYRLLVGVEGCGVLRVLWAAPKLVCMQGAVSHPCMHS